MNKSQTRVLKFEHFFWSFFRIQILEFRISDASRLARCVGRRTYQTRSQAILPWAG